MHSYIEIRARERGFTLIELLVVIVIMGILAAIAIPKYQSTKESSYDAAAKSDLRNLMTKQEQHYVNYGQYASDVTATESANSSRIVVQGSGEITVGQDLEITDGGGSGTPTRYTAHAKHPKSDRCWEISVGPDKKHRIKQAASCGLGGS